MTAMVSDRRCQPECNGDISQQVVDPKNNAEKSADGLQAWRGPH